MACQSTGSAGTPQDGSGAPSQQVTVFCLQPGHSHRLASGSYCVPQCRHSTPAVSLTGVVAGAGGAPVAVVRPGSEAVVCSTATRLGATRDRSRMPR